MIFAALGQCGFDQLRCLLAGGHVVRADITGALAFFRVAVGADQKRFAGEAFRKSVWLSASIGTDGDAVHAAGDEVAQYILLRLGGVFGGKTEFQIHITQLSAWHRSQPSCAMDQYSSAVLATKASRNFFFESPVAVPLFLWSHPETTPEHTTRK